ncbi:MAG: MopE-related protein [Myxococcota bacterium]
MLPLFIFSVVGTAKANVPVDLLNPGDLVVTEVMHSVSAVPDYRGEWIEVYNNSGVDVNLDGLVLTDGVQSTTINRSNFVVTAGSYVVFGTRYSNLNGGASVQYVYPNSQLRLAGNEQVSLVAGSVTLDTFDWDSGGSYPAALNTSLSLSPSVLSASGNDTSSNWCLPSSTYGSVNLYGTPGAANDSCPVDLSSVSAGDLVVSEVMYAPSRTVYYRGEWFEIHNASSNYININGLVINGGPVSETFTINSDINIRPGESALIANRTQPLYNGGMSNVNYAYSYNLNRLFNNDSLTLSYNSNTIDSLNWTSTYGGALGVAINLDSRALDATSNDNSSSWCAAVTTYGDGDFGTPGNTNAECSGFDGDGDTYTVNNGDCDDTDSTINPDADEVCDGVDNNCDGDIDINATDGSTYYADSDGDGFGDASTTIVACSQPTGYVSNSDDCDDTRSNSYLGAPEVCDGIDNDCDGSPDNNPTDGTTYYSDSDGDGYGDDNNTLNACSQPSNYAEFGGDCQDGDTSINPGAAEDCSAQSDLNCDGFIGLGDNDGDGFDACQECNDNNSAINPNASEVCDGVDNNCDGNIDDSTASDALTWFQDGDGDGYGNLNSTVQDCARPSGYVADSNDCDDGDSNQYPGAPEVCNSEDDDCDSTIDEPGATGTIEVYADTDGDSYGDINNTAQYCTGSIPSGYVADSQDCDDTNININPAAQEVCDSIDNDCDGDIDDNDTSVDTSGGNTYYRDSDNDLYGDLNNALQSCSLPVGYRTNSTDCDDTNYAIRPNAQEVCDSVDNDCDTLIDDSDPSLGGSASEYYVDSDDDTYGDPATLTNTCSSGPGFVQDNTDCDDNNDSVNPGATEVCNGIDDNCSGDESDAPSSNPYYADSDGDTYGDPDTIFNACVQPSGYVTDNTDCNDSDINVNPGATEVCDASNVDEDCSGDADDADTGVDTSTYTTYYRDTDLDFYGDNNDTVTQCDAPTLYRVLGGDCDETNASINPGATEICDGVDNNCDSQIDEGLTTESYYTDSDGDGFGDANDATPTSSCTAISGEVTNNTDCDDSDSTVNPGATEICLDDVDQDCDGSDNFGVCDGSSSDADLILSGLGDNHVTGWAISSVGDFNGDGNADFMLSARGDTTFGTGTGTSYVFYGPLTGSETLSNADLVIAGSSGDALATSGSGGIDAPSGDSGFLSIDGNINGDAFDDLLLGSNTNNSGTGAAYLFYGSSSQSGQTSTTSADAIFTGEAAGNFAGQAVAMLGDINGDSIGDLAISAPRVYENNGRFQAGRTYVFYGSSATPLSGTISLSTADVTINEARARDRLGLGLAGVGDVTGDGVNDLAVGAYRRDRYTVDNHPNSCDPNEDLSCLGNEGQVMVWQGGTLAASETPEDADITYFGEGNGDNIGETISGAGDIDGDGISDLAFGSSYYQNQDRRGVYYIVNGNTSGDQELALSNSNVIARFIGNNVGDQLGRNATRLGDLDGDGNNDFAISARGVDVAGADAGAIYVFLGPLSGDYSGSDADVVIDGETAGDFFGGDIKAAGDIDNDGSMDLIIGATSTGNNAGSVYLLYGSHF